MKLPSIDSNRLWSDLMNMAAIGSTPRGGSDRLTATAADGDARHLFAHWCREAGLPVQMDAVGNIFALWEGTDPSLPPVFVGSHLDTQSPGGKFDGVLGVLAALECVRTLKQAGLQPRRGIQVVNWTNEEGARFAPGLLGSAVFTGQHPLADALATRDKAGISLGDALQRINCAGDAPLGRPADSYFELHIEQGDRLQNAGKDIGVVIGCEYNCFVDINCYGENGHSQATPMAQRVNSLAAASELIVAIEKIGNENAPVGTAGVAAMDIWPNNRINIPHHTKLTYAATHPDRQGMLTLRARVVEAAAEIAKRTGVRIEVDSPPDRAAVDFNPALGDMVEKIASDLGFSTMRLRSRAGHDAIRMTHYCPTQMIFVPCKDGISHSELEDCTQEECANGANVLLNTLYAQANRT